MITSPHFYFSSSFFCLPLSYNLQKFIAAAGYMAFLPKIECPVLHEQGR